MNDASTPSKFSISELTDGVVAVTEVPQTHVRMSSPAPNERANCSLVASAVTDATGVAVEEGDDKYMLWVVTCEKVIGSKELTMLYNHKNYKRDYKTGDPPLRAPPNAANMYRLIRTYCEHTHVSYKELVNEYGAQKKNINFCGLFDSFACTTEQ